MKKILLLCFCIGVLVIFQCTDLHAYAHAQSDSTAMNFQEGADLTDAMPIELKTILLKNSRIGHFADGSEITKDDRENFSSFLGFLYLFLVVGIGGVLVYGFIMELTWINRR